MAKRAVVGYCGPQLRRLRVSRGMSQMALAFAAGVSARHVGFIELGRAFPGRDVLLRLGAALFLSEGEMGTLLAGAGFSPALTPPVGPTKEQLAQLVEPVRAILKNLGQLPAVLLDGRWDIVMANAAYVKLSIRVLGCDRFLRGPLAVTEPPRPNRLGELFNPAARSHIENWTDVAGTLIARVRQELRLTQDPTIAALLDRTLGGPGVPREWRAEGFVPTSSYPIRLHLRFGSRRLRLYSVVNAWATAFPGLRVELLQPVDERSQQELADGQTSG